MKMKQFYLKGGLEQTPEPPSGSPTAFDYLIRCVKCQFWVTHYVYPDLSNPEWVVWSGFMLFGVAYLSQYLG